MKKLLLTTMMLFFSFIRIHGAIQTFQLPNFGDKRFIEKCKTYQRITLLCTSLVHTITAFTEPTEDKELQKHYYLATKLFLQIIISKLQQSCSQFCSSDKFDLLYFSLPYGLLTDQSIECASQLGEKVSALLTARTKRTASLITKNYPETKPETLSSWCLQHYLFLLSTTLCMLQKLVTQISIETITTTHHDAVDIITLIHSSFYEEFGIMVTEEEDEEEEKLPQPVCSPGARYSSSDDDSSMAPTPRSAATLPKPTPKSPMPTLH